jgi:hypothetical protein
MSPRKLVFALSLAAIAAPAAIATAQVTGYGVNSFGQLFKFDINAPGLIPFTIIGAPLPFVPEGIDFRPGTTSLYAIDVGPNTSQLYTIDINTGVPTAVGSSFTSSGTSPGNYNLTNATSFGFDFNPKTQQGDNSMRIRLVSNTGTNLRLNSSTGQIAAVDPTIAYIPAVALSVDAVAYINNIPAASGVTGLYDIDYANDQLAKQDPATGVLTAVGALGVTVDVLQGVSFDIYTDPTSVDDTVGGDTGYAVAKRTATSGGAYLLYNVDLTNGFLTNGKTIGVSLVADFTGGFAVVPEPGSMLLAGFAAAGLFWMKRKFAA